MSLSSREREGPACISAAIWHISPREGEGSGAACVCDPDQYAVKIMDDIAVGDPQDVKTGCVQECIAASIIGDLTCMGIAVNFNDKPTILTQEIDDIGADWDLSPEFEIE